MNLDVRLAKVLGAAANAGEEAVGKAVAALLVLPSPSLRDTSVMLTRFAKAGERFYRPQIGGGTRWTTAEVSNVLVYAAMPADTELDIQACAADLAIPWDDFDHVLWEKAVDLAVAMSADGSFTVC